MPPPRPLFQPTSGPAHRGERIVAVGLLTQRDLDVLGTGFRRLFPIEETGGFDDLLRQLDRLPPSRD